MQNPILLSLAAACLAAASADAAGLKLNLRRQVETAPGSGQYETVEKAAEWDPRKTAIIICDMWNQHWCQGASARVAEMAPTMNQVLLAARRQGILIIHAPSDTLKFYEGWPQVSRVLNAPRIAPPSASNWQSLNLAKEGPLPIDDSDGGCDCEPHCPQGGPWRSQIATLEIAAEDAISDSGAAIYNLLQQRGIENLIIMGVHTNMCVLGRSFAIRQMVQWGKKVALMRDLTDTMYNSRKKPWVSHFRGTDLVVGHIEKYWCPTLTSTALTGQPPFRFQADRRPKVVFLSVETEYQSKTTLAAFARNDLAFHYGWNCTFLQSDRADDLPGLEALKEADLAVFFMRRTTLPPAQLKLIRAYLEAGKPVVALRTSSHAFQNWLAFDGEVLGGHYAGHFNNRDPKTRVWVMPEAQGHPILKGLSPEPFLVSSWLYKTRPLGAQAVPLMLGRVDNQTATEPVAWVNQHQGARVFYTSLGHPDDFAMPEFRRLLRNGIFWALSLEIPANAVTF